MSISSICIYQYFIIIQDDSKFVLPIPFDISFNILLSYFCATNIGIYQSIKRKTIELACSFKEVLLKDDLYRMIGIVYAQIQFIY
jgi:hypothetical protein